MCLSYIHTYSQDEIASYIHTAETVTVTHNVVGGVWLTLASSATCSSPWHTTTGNPHSETTGTASATGTGYFTYVDVILRMRIHTAIHFAALAIYMYIYVHITDYGCTGRQRRGQRRGRITATSGDARGDRSRGVCTRFMSI